jgi:hypothetical protein
LRKKTYLSTYTKKIVQFVGNLFSKPQYSLVKSIGRQQEVPGIYKLQRKANGVQMKICGIKRKYIIAAENIRAIMMSAHEIEIWILCRKVRE